MLGHHVPAIGSPPPTINDEMQMIFIRLSFSQPVAQKLLEDQWIDSPKTLASLSTEDISAIYDVIRRFGGLVNKRTPDRGDQTSVLATSNLKLAMFIFKIMK